MGASPPAEIVLAGAGVCPLHAELEGRDDGLWVRDLGSATGTFVGGVMVREARVPSPGRLTLGGLSLVVERGEGRGAARARPEGAECFGPLVGASPKMLELYDQISNLARAEALVLIEGETGTGKELVARALHEASARARGPFLIVDCGALPEHLLEAELFGHVKGAFTGATSARAGVFEQARGGTVFLDEIGELPPSMQPKLLRVLEAKTVRRVGEALHRPVDVRLLAATHRDLSFMAASGALRHDLLFRLAVLPLRVPPLRERAEDIPRLMGHFLAGRPPLEASVLAALARRAWPGNVRELRNFVERACALGVERALALPEPPASGGAPAPAGGHAARGASGAARGGAGREGEASREPVGEVETLRAFREAWQRRGDRDYLRRLLAVHGGNKTEAARAAGVHRAYFYRLLSKSGLTETEGR